MCGEFEPFARKTVNLARVFFIEHYCRLICGWVFCTWQFVGQALPDYRCGNCRAQPDRWTGVRGNMVFPRLESCSSSNHTGCCVTNDGFSTLTNTARWVATFSNASWAKKKKAERRESEIEVFSQMRCERRGREETTKQTNYTRGKKSRTECQKGLALVVFDWLLAQGHFKAWTDHQRVNSEVSSSLP